MAPGAGKRKRNERHDDGGRPSPHRPESMNLAQQQQRYDGRTYGRGRGRSNYGAPGGGHEVNRMPLPPPTGPGTPAQVAGSAAASPAPVSERPATPFECARTPVQRLPPSPPRGPPAPYDYDCLTDQVVSSWQESGRQMVLDMVTPAEDDSMLSMVLQELLRSALDGRLGPAEAGTAVRDMIDAQAADLQADLNSFVIDLVNILDPSDLRRSILNPFMLASNVPALLWRERLDHEVAQTLGLVRSSFATNKVRKGTNLLYRQANYNLLREETEGYAKLITESFNTAMSAGATDSAPTIAEDAFQRVKALVGSFDLDVGRVLDITLDIFANLLVRNFRFFIKFIRASSWWPVESFPEDIQWQGQGFDALPGWALPGCGHWGLGPEEAERAASIQPLREARDRRFWDQVREKGLDAFSEIGARHITNYDAVLNLLNTEVQPELDSRRDEKTIVKRKRTNDARKWMRDTHMLPPQGNADAAQLLGFKIAFYASSTRNRHDVMPDNLIFLTALLIKVGFINLRDIYPHLYPRDDMMSDVREKLENEKEKAERESRPGGSAKNALAMAGALADDTVPAVRALRADAASSKVASPKPDGALTPSRAGEGDRDSLPEPPDQKILLLKSLLAIGALPEALFILGRFPWLPEVVPDIPEHVHRVVHHMLSKVYEHARPLSDREGLSNQRNYVGDSAGLPKGSLRLVSPPQKVSKRWANLDRGDVGDGFSYKFYWDDWADNVPICQSVEDVFQLCATFLNYSGVKIGRDPSLLMKFARIGKKSLQDDFSEANQARWIDMLKRLLVPALSLTSKNPGLVNEVFDLLQLFPTSTRYSVYAEWHFGPTSRLPDVKAAFDQTRAEAKDVLKRISKTNVKAMGKMLAKVAYASPGVVLQTAINQMESYSNLIDVFVECSRYFSPLGYDVLTWCLLNALGGAGRNRIQADGMLTSSWLQALSNFAGAVFKRYANTDPSPILQYVANELQNGNSTDLEILEQIVTGMAGIKSDMTFNDVQILAMAGGEVLQAQTIIALKDERHKMEKSSKRLMKSLTERGLAGQLLISIAQERQMYVHHDSAKHAPLKVLGNNVDKIHQVFAQYLETLRAGLTPSEFSNAVPDVADLISEYGLEPSIAFMIGRSAVAKAIVEVDAAKKLEQQEKSRKLSLAKLQTNGDIAMTDADEKSAGVSTEDTAVQKVGTFGDASLDGKAARMDGAEPEVEMVDVALANGLPDASPAPAPVPQEITNGKTIFWHPALSPLIDQLGDVMGKQFQTAMSMPFYVTFWSLALEDILVDTKSYELETLNQNQEINKIKNHRPEDKQPALTPREKEKKIKAIHEVIDRLSQEVKTQISVYSQVRSRLNKEKEHWFRDFIRKIDILNTSILQDCFLPRMLLSPLDAHYTFTMMKYLHGSGTPGFRTMPLLDKLMRKNQLAAIMYQCTAREAENFGRFLMETLKEMQTWHADKTVYERNAFGLHRQLPGFARRISADCKPEVFLEYEDFRRLLYKWHTWINGAFKQCFESGEYMHIRNAIIALLAVHAYFPAVNFMGKDMLTKVTGLSDGEKREDLKLAATSLLAALKRREKSWQLPQAYRISETAPSGQKGTPSQATTPQPAKDPTVKPLSAAAADFKPGGGSQADAATSKTTVATNGDAEDGEIDDEKRAETRDIAPGSATNVKGSLSNQAAEVLFNGKAIGPGKSDDRASPLPAPALEARVTPVPSRPASTQPAHSRAPHALPARPDSRQPSRVSSRPDPPRQDGRDRETYGRLDRPTEMSRSAPGNPKDLNAAPRSRPRTPDQDYELDRRNVPAPSRADERPPIRSQPQDDRSDSRVGPYTAPIREPEPPLTQLEEARRRAKESMPPQRTSAPPNDRPDLTRPDRFQPPQSMSRAPSYGSSNPAMQQRDAPVTVNPERLSMIEKASAGADRRPRDMPPAERRQDYTSRPQSPRRHDGGAPTPFHPSRVSNIRDDREPPNDRGPYPTPSTQGGRRDVTSEHAPTGPRIDRGGRTDRDLFEQGQPVRAHAEPQSASRPSQDSSRQQESTYGRLNAPSEAPQGPRFPSQTQSRTNGNPGQSPTVPPPASPSSMRVPERVQTMAPAPSTAMTESAPANAGIHPSRLDRVQPAPIQTTNVAATPRIGGPPVGTPTGPSPSKTTPPLGPASAADKSRNQDRRFAGINDALQGVGNGTNIERGASIRGRAGRQNGTMMPPAPPAQTQQSMPSHQPPRDMPRDMTRDMAREMPRDMPRDTQRDMSRDVAPRGNGQAPSAQAHPSRVEMMHPRLVGAPQPPQPQPYPDQRHAGRYEEDRRHSSRTSEREHSHAPRDEGRRPGPERPYTDRRDDYHDERSGPIMDRGDTRGSVGNNSSSSGNSRGPLPPRDDYYDRPPPPTRAPLPPQQVSAGLGLEPPPRSFAGPPQDPYSRNGGRARTDDFRGQAPQVDARGGGRREDRNGPGGAPFMGGPGPGPGTGPGLGPGIGMGMGHGPGSGVDMRGEWERDGRKRRGDDVHGDGKRRRSGM